jgi:hypothetical protein
MIAHFIFELPSPLNIRLSDSLTPLEVSHKGVLCLVYPPCQWSATEDAPARGPVHDMVSIDGEQTVLANVLRVDITGDFDRSDQAKVGQEYRIALEVVQKTIALLRTLSRAPFVLAPDEHTSWRVRYLRDDGTEFDPTPGLVRARGQLSIPGPKRAWIAPEMWNALPLQERDPSPSSDDLILDALNLGPQVGAAIVLAYTSIEVRIATALELLAARNASIIGQRFWTWVNDRGNFLKEPSVKEQLTDMLDMLSGRSMKRESVLWAAYIELRKARNSFVHEGKALLPGGVHVTPEKAMELVGRAQEIVDWIELGLSPSERRPTVALPNRQMQMLIPIPTAQTASPAEVTTTPTP